MVSPRKRKPTKPAGSSRRAARQVSVQIRTNIPFDEKELVTRTQVTRSANNRIRVAATQIKVPIIPSTKSNPSDSSPPDHNDPHTSDQPADPQTKQSRKGPSRSAAVCQRSLYSTQ